MRGTRSNGLLALGGIALAAVLASVGHLQVNDDLDPWTLTVSDYAVSDRGGVIDVAMVVLAAATAVLLPALRRIADAPAPDPRVRGAGSPRTVRLAEVLLVAWVGGLVLAAVVPTNEPGLPMDTAAYLHRYASVVAFLALPLAGLLLAGRLAGGRWVRGFAVASLVLAGAMVWSAFPGDRMLLGLAERLLILAEVGVLGVVAVTLAAGHGTVDRSWRRAPTAPAPPAGRPATGPPGDGGVTPVRAA